MAGADLPGAYRRTLRRAAAAADLAAEYVQLRNRFLRIGRRARQASPRASPPPTVPARSSRASIRPPSPATSRAPATFFRCEPKRAACWCAPARPRLLSTWRAWPALTPAGVICEIMNEDGTMARVPQLKEFCVRHGLKMISVAELIRYRLKTRALRPPAGRRLYRDRIRRRSARSPIRANIRANHARNAFGADSRRSGRPGERAGADALALRLRRCVRIHRMRMPENDCRLAAPASPMKEWACWFICTRPAWDTG